MILVGTSPVQGKGTPMPELLATFGARELNLLMTSITWVCGKMSTQIWLESKSFTTVCTTKWSLPCMQEHVICLDILTMETFSTNVTPIAWFLEINQGWRETVTKVYSIQWKHVTELPEFSLPVHITICNFRPAYLLGAIH